MALTREKKQSICTEYGINSQDTGSSKVQVALLTARIAELTEHCKTHKKDFSTRRGLLQMVADRRKHLDYLKKNNSAQHQEIMAKLGLRK